MYARLLKKWYHSSASAGKIIIWGLENGIKFQFSSKSSIFHVFVPFSRPQIKIGHAVADEWYHIFGSLA